MGFHLRDRGLARRIALHEKRLQQIEGALPLVVNALNQQAMIFKALQERDAALAQTPHDYESAAARQKADLSERAKLKAQLRMVPPLA